MKKVLFIVYSLSVCMLLMMVMSACGPKRPHTESDEEEEDPEEEEWEINGGDSDQPIMDGWTFEMAAEYYLANELEYEYSRVIRNEGEWLKPEALACLTRGHVQVDIPVQEKNAKPRFNVTYRQPNAGGTITFSGESTNNPTIYGDNLPAVGEATFHFNDDMYDYQSEPYTAYVQSRGQGLYTLYRMEGTRDENNEWHDHCNPVWYPVIISVYPGGDSLVISRGMEALETFVPEK